MLAPKEYRLNRISPGIWKWKYVLTILALGFIWWTRPGWQPSSSPSSWHESLRTSVSKFASASTSGDSYSEDGIKLQTFSKITCDWDTLPDRIRTSRHEVEGTASRGYWLFNHGFGDVVSDGNWGLGGWELNFGNVMERYLRAISRLEPSRHIFLDMGANIGTHTVHMAAHGYETHAWEPTHANYVLTHCALAMSNLPAPVRFNHFGLGAKASTACIESVGYNMGDSVANVDFSTCEPANTASIGTLDHYYRTFLRGRKVALVKIDVQGFELIAFEHGRQLFDSQDAPEIVIFEWEPERMTLKGSNAAGMFRFLEERDYVMFDMGNGAVIESTKLTDLELEELHFKDGVFMLQDVVAMKRSWKKKAESEGLVFHGGHLDDF